MREVRVPRRYRLLQRVEVGWTVSFPSVVYVVEIVKVTGAPQWDLRAASMDGSTHWSLCRGEWLDRSIYERGFEVMSATVPAMIMEALVKQGRAERMGWTEQEKARAERK